MQTLGKIISRYIQIITLTMVFALLVIIGCTEISKEQKSAYEDAMGAFHRIEQTLEQNQKELEEIGLEYSKSCLDNAEAIAYLIQNNPAALENTEELRRIAEFIEVDEIHFFDSTGRIFAGTHPEYFDFTLIPGSRCVFSSLCWRINP